MSVEYSIIIADPPWPYTSDRMVLQGGTVAEGASDHYSTMSMADLCALPISHVRPRNGLLYLWTTGPKMAEALELMRAWGYKYSTIAYVWDKGHSNPGYYTCSVTEFVLVGKRGKAPRRLLTNERQLISERRRRHSQKPEAVQDSIDRMWEDVPRLELFARRDRPGWTCVGNECPSTDGIDIADWLRKAG